MKNIFQSLRNEYLSVYFQHYKLDADGLCTQLTQAKSNTTTVYRDVHIEAFEKAGWGIKEADIKVQLLQFREALETRQEQDFLSKLRNIITDSK